MGLRVMMVTTTVIERMICDGGERFRPVDVPADLRVLRVRLNLVADRIDCIVWSKSFDGDNPLADGPFVCPQCMGGLFESLPRWVPAFRRLERDPAEVWPGWLMEERDGLLSASCRHCDFHQELQLPEEPVGQFRARCQRHGATHWRSAPPVPLVPSPPA